MVNPAWLGTTWPCRHNHKADMYDTVNFWINRADTGKSISTIPCYLGDVIESTNCYTGEVWQSGRVENMKVSTSIAGVSIKGSLAKFFFPDNTYTLNRHQVREAIEKLSDRLHLPLMEAKATRIDVSANFIMSHEVGRYFDVLRDCPYYHRIQASDNTLYYNRKGKEQARGMVFYDKATEVGDRYADIPDVYAGENLLRYEMRWNGRLPQQLNEPEIIGKTLYDPFFYRKIVKEWGDNYFKIEKKKQVKAESMESIKTVSDAKEYIFAITLNRLPADELQGILRDLKANKVFDDPKYYTRLKKKLSDIASKAEILESGELVKELDGEVKQVLSYIR